MAKLEKENLELMAKSGKLDPYVNFLEEENEKCKEVSIRHVYKENCRSNISKPNPRLTPFQLL